MVAVYLDDTPDLITLARKEIYEQYGHVTRVGRKSLRKYGANDNVTSAGFFDINEFCDGTPQNETYLTTNAVDSISSSAAGDTDVAIYIEGMTRSGDDFTFVSQTVNTDASNGQTRVALTTPLCDVTRVRGVAAGDVYVYENTTLSAGVPTDQTKVHNKMSAGEGSSLKAGTSIASTNYFILTKYWATIGKASGANAVDMRAKVATLGDSVFGDSFYTDEAWTVALGSNVNGPPVEPYEIIKPNSRILLRASASGGTIAVRAGFVGFFADIVENGEFVYSKNRSFI